MAKRILTCPNCKKYTLKQVCDVCNAKTVEPKPPKYSPEDKYARFRREAKEQEYKEKELL